MLEGALYLASSFWLGAVHAATPGHGKTVSAAYLVGTRGRPADAVALGIFVTLAHTSGIAVFAVLATLGSASLSQRSESYVSLVMALLILGIGLWMLAGQWHRLPFAHSHVHEPAGDHTHFGVSHSHQPERLFAGDGRPSWTLLLGLGLAGGLLPDPAALAVLLAAIASGKLVVGLLTVLVFSLGFASVLVLVGAVVGRLGQAAVAWVDGAWMACLQVVTAGLIVVVGTAMTLGAWRQLAEWR
jgi:nickel/cobalt exporter